MANYQRIRFVTANFSTLQGLRALPVALFLFIVALWSSTQSTSQGDITFPLLSLPIVLMLIWLTNRYYKNRFGRVQRTRGQKITEAALSVVFMALAYLAFWLDTSRDLPFSMFGLVFAAGLLSDYLRMRLSVPGDHFLQRPYLLLVTLQVLVSLLPLFGLDNWWLGINLPSQLAGVMAVTAVLLLLVGLVGHRFLSASLAPRGR